MKYTFPDQVPPKEITSLSDAMNTAASLLRISPEEKTLMSVRAADDEMAKMVSLIMAFEENSVEMTQELTYRTITVKIGMREATRCNFGQLGL